VSARDANLYEAINNLVDQRLRDAFETGQIVNVPDLASEMAESLADLIVCSAPPEEQTRLMAHVVEELGAWSRKSATPAQARRCSSDIFPPLRLRNVPR